MAAVEPIIVVDGVVVAVAVALVVVVVLIAAEFKFVFFNWFSTLFIVATDVPVTAIVVANVGDVVADVFEELFEGLTIEVLVAGVAGVEEIAATTAGAAIVAVFVNAAMMKVL